MIKVIKVSREEERLCDLEDRKKIGRNLEKSRKSSKSKIQDFAKIKHACDWIYVRMKVRSGGYK